MLGKRFVSRRGVLIGAAITLSAMAVGVVFAMGMRVQPGGALVQGVPVGERRELPAPLVIFNDDDAPHVVTVSAYKPSAVGGRPKRGYNEIPDAAWMTFQPDAIEAPARGKGSIKMFLSVPADKKLLNQHWSVNLAVRSKTGKGKQIGLAIYPRFEIETACGVTDIPPAGDLGITPSVLSFEKVRPGSKVPPVICRIWNNTKKTHDFKLTVHGRPAKNKKPIIALSGGKTWIPDSSWVALEKTEVAVGPNESAEIGIRVMVPGMIENYGGAWEAILLFTRDDGVEAFARIRITTSRKAAEEEKVAET